MRYVIGGLVAAVLALGAFVLIRGGGPEAAGPKAPVVEDGSLLKGFEQFLSADFSYPEGGETNVEALFALLPDEITAAYETNTFTAETGATVLTAVELRSAERPDMGVDIDELILWDVDADALAARIDGSNLPDSVPLARRIEAKGLSVVGLDEAYEPLVDSMNSMLEEAAREDGVDVDMAMSFEDYDLTVGRFIVDGLTLEPWEIGPERAVDEFNEVDLEVFRFAQQAAAFLRSYSIDAATMEDLSGTLAYSQMGAGTDMTFKIEFAGYQGLDRGDLGACLVTNMTSEGTTAWPDFSDMEGLASDRPSFVQMPVTSRMAMYSIENVRMNKALEYLAKGEMPPASEADLFSLGLWKAEGVDYSMNDMPFYSVRAMSADMTGFKWFMPTKISFDIEDMSYNLRAFESLFAGALEEAEPEAAQAASDVMNILEENGFAAPVFSVDFDWNYNADIGPATLSFNSEMENFGRFESGTTGALPTYETWAPLMKFEDGKIDEAAVEEAFRDGASFTQGFVRLIDQGGIERVFKMAVEIAGVIPDGGPQVEAFAQYDPQTVRNLAVAAVQMGGTQAKTTFPPAKDWADTYAAYLAEGGVFEFRVAPPQPITLDSIEAFDEADGEPEPEEIIEFFGIEVEHTAP